MSISLQKGQRISLTKEAPGLTQLMCGLGWDVAQKSVFFGGLSNSNFDLDASVICLDENNKLKNFKDIIYYGNLQHSSSAITHLGDNLTGAGEGDDEVILVNLPKVPNNIARLVFIVNIYKCLERKQDFAQVQNAFVRLVNSANNQELARYNLSGKDYTGMTGMTLAEVYRHNNEWKMAAIGNGFNANSLQEISKFYS